MSQTIVALFDELSEADAALNELDSNGIPRDSISVVANNHAEGYNRFREHLGLTAAGTGAEVGTAVGGVGGILLGLGLLVIPGLGPIAAAGWLVAGLTGAGIGAAAGAATGGIVDSLEDEGVSGYDAGYYAEGIRRGGTLVSVKADELDVDRIMNILNRNGAIDINERADYYKKTGYVGYDHAAKPYSSDELVQERVRLQQALDTRADNTTNTTDPVAGRPSEGYSDAQRMNEKIGDISTGRLDNKTGMPN